MLVNPSQMFVDLTEQFVLSEAGIRLGTETLPKNVEESIEQRNYVQL